LVGHGRIAPGRGHHHRGAALRVGIVRRRQHRVPGSRAAGEGVANVPVVLNDPDSGANYSYTTDSNGCLYVPNLPPDSTPSGKGYTITLSEPGWVSGDGFEASTESTSGVNVTAGTLTTLTAGLLSYDDGATIDVTYTGGTPPSGLPVTISNSSLKPTGRPPRPARRRPSARCTPTPPATRSGWVTAVHLPRPSKASRPRTGCHVQRHPPPRPLNVQVYNSSGQAVSGGLVTVTPSGCADTTPYQMNLTNGSGATTAGMPPASGITTGSSPDPGTWIVTAYSGPTSASPEIGSKRSPSPRQPKR